MEIKGKEEENKMTTVCKEEGKKNGKRGNDKSNIHKTKKTLK